MPQNKEIHTLYSPFDTMPRVSSDIGMRNGKFHRGKDCARPPQYMEIAQHCSDVPGIAICGYEREGFGNYVYIRLANGRGVVYSHLHTILVRTGQAVNYDTPIGLVGNTGEVWPDPTPSNPHNGMHLHHEYHEDYEAGFTKQNTLYFQYEPRKKKGKKLNELFSNNFKNGVFLIIRDAQGNLHWRWSHDGVSPFITVADGTGGRTNETPQIIVSGDTLTVIISGLDGKTYRRTSSDGINFTPWKDISE